MIISSKKSTFWWHWLIIVSLFCLSCVAQAKQISDAVISSPILNAATQQLTVEQARNVLLANKLKNLQREKQHLKLGKVTASLLQHAELAVKIAQADVEGIALSLKAAQQAVSLTQSNIDELDGQRDDITALSTTSANMLEQLQQQRAQQLALLNIQQAHVKSLQKSLSLAQQILSSTQDFQAQIQANYQLQQQQQRQQALDLLAANLQKEQQTWLNRLNQLNEQLPSETNGTPIERSALIKLEMAILEAEEKSNLIGLQLDLAKLNNRVEDLAVVVSQPLSLNALNNAQRQTDSLIDQLGAMRSMVQTKSNQLQKRIEIAAQNAKLSTAASQSQSDIGILRDLQSRYQKQLSAINDTEKQLHAYRVTFAEQLNKQLASRQGLPGLSAAAWWHLGQKLVEVPVVAWNTLTQLHKPLWFAITATSAWQWVIVLLLAVVWSLLWHSVRKYLDKGIAHLEQPHRNLLVQRRALWMGLKLLRRYLAGLVMLALFLSGLLALSISWQAFALVIGLAVIVMSFSAAAYLAGLLLMDNTVETADIKTQRTLRRVRGILTAGAILTGLTFTVQQLPVAYDVQDLFSRAFMLFLLIVCLLLVRSWYKAPGWLNTYLEGKRPYVKQVARWLSLLIPLTLLSNAILGLIGYVELAWAMAAYQGIFLIVFTGYLLARGILGEALRLLSEQLIRRVRNGWLWSEALLKPAHQILKILLFIGAIWVLFSWYGWGKNSLVVIKIKEFFRLQLFSLAGSSITPWSIVELLIIIAVLIWLARWTREFAYRWLFARTKDLGLRNSLAILSQYTVVIVGILIALRIVGINLTALTVIASAFAFGIGLGLRDLANNFVSGILLLLERPVRVGDWVSMGNHEGEVVHIGMRSVTVTTDDHQELLIPNADVFSKAFINWTHRDAVVRCTFSIKICREDDPRRVQKIIEEELAKIPKILTKPAIEVYLREIDDVLLEFKAGYYVDLRAISSRSAIRSQVLFALWERFKAEGIQSPDVAHHVHIRGELNKFLGKEGA